MLVTNSKDSAVYYKYLEELFVQVLKLYEKALPKLTIREVSWCLATLLMIVQIYHGSLLPLRPNQEILNSMLKIFENLQCPEFNEIFAQLQDAEFEGVSPTTEKIYETSHPLERGKNYNFPARKFQNATILLLELDKRCQSDPNNDVLTVQIIHEDSPVGNNIQVNDGVFNSSVRLSGAVDTKKPYLIFGKAVTVDFNSSGHVKDTHSLVRFGFKFGLRPVFTGKLRASDEKKDKINKVFQSV